MSRKLPGDDIGFDEQGRPIAIGQEAADREAAIIEHPDAQPILIVAILNGEMGIRIYQPPSEDVAAALDQVAKTYRQVLARQRAKES